MNLESNTDWNPWTVANQLPGVRDKGDVNFTVTQELISCAFSSYGLDDPNKKGGVVCTETAGSTSYIPTLTDAPATELSLTKKDIDVAYVASWISKAFPNT